MIKKIHILGASGSGTTTLGQALAARLGYRHFDTDNYFWLPTKPPFKEQREEEERKALLAHDLHNTTAWILSGSLCGWGDIFIPAFELVVFLWIPPALRMARLAKREIERYGEENIKAGGAMYAASQAFLTWAAGYDEGGLDMRSRARHEQWLAGLPCRILRLEGDLSVAERVEAVWQEIQYRAGR